MIQDKSIIVGLMGNPNTGKTSLLNALTGLRLHVGNWPGKTVEKREGKINFHGKNITIIDLPGTYSISPYSEEERISHDFVMNQDSDVIVQIIDVNALGRNLLLTFELLALNKNVILAFNFNKEAEKRGIKIKVKKIKEVLQIPIVQIEANTGENKDVLLEQIIASSHYLLKSPSYLETLLNIRGEISHGKSIDFIKTNIAPLYFIKKQSQQTEKIDAWLLNKYIAFPFFILIVYLMFKATFLLSTPLVNIVDSFFSWLGGFVETLGLHGLITSFLVEGVIGGVGSVLTFTPLIFVLFLIIALLEDTGYLSRAVVLVDKLFHKFGISGRTFIPMILGFGCNVPAIMATRTIRNKKERTIAIFINSFMSCGARLPVYVLFASIFFPQSATMIVMLLYLLGVVVAFLVSFVLARIIKNTEINTLIIELPPYRIPVLLNILKNAWHQTYLFIKKAGTIILAAVIFIWFLASLPFGVEYGSSGSLLGKAGQIFAPIFKPLGFSHWVFVVALLFGLIAKEIIIGTLGTLYGVSAESLPSIIPNYITPLASLSFLIFVLLYIPCLATVAVIKKETNSWKFTIAHIITTIIIAWLASLAVYRIGLLLGFH